MSANRRQLLLQRSNSLAAANNQALPQEIRDLYSKAAGQADQALGLQEARDRKQDKALQSATPEDQTLQPVPAAADQVPPEAQAR